MKLQLQFSEPTRAITRLAIDLSFSGVYSGDADQQNGILTTRFDKT
ncbi:hypothetical protein [Chitinophaga filiformis]|uniref:Uncharacterized protein n=1 Tax=Chitinophaga filiformis TaxID=104663 RepID=A0ABY4I0T6_CHIFI|nr:hypothetical protein [Chitinophaga filiformis]UPK69696.1 hypothetical protein MYF79_00145 [Chitinophaga filiformis]